MVKAVEATLPNAIDDAYEVHGDNSYKIQMLKLAYKHFTNKEYKVTRDNLYLS